MQLSDLISRFRTLANDKVEPYFIDDASVIDWLNDAVSEACIRGRLLHESQNEEVCKITLTTGVANYALHESLYELSRIWFEPGDGTRGHYLALMSAENMDQRYKCDNWKLMRGVPQFAIQDDTGIRLVPIPSIDGEVQLEGYRVPLSALKNDTDIPEINSIHHVHLVQWALHQAFNVPDAEFFDPNRSAQAEQVFTDYFGIRSDSDLRRITREDIPHAVVPFMP
ncbi:hypothetical protein [Acinetobacter sp. SWAC57]|uniref:phage adaptor protein n=1 Tax=Acinetobacter sp. SWAC57 TaxID=2293834 RepID=UPI000E5C3D9F|nr:hypothetical protein [Acinetobacter sp. SWAC57]RGD90566.1 hypothetical protein DYI96_10375 [Acinetobacter sp. SWAC57]